MTALTLFTKPDCPLCDEAVTLINHLKSTDLSLTMIDITTDPSLFDRYASRIPVLRLANNKELNWPFNAQAIITQLNDYQRD